MVDTLAPRISRQDAVFSWSEHEGWTTARQEPAREVALTIYLDKVELATLMCTPEKLNFLVAGFLRTEGIIGRLDDLALMRVCDEEQMAEVRLMRPVQIQGKRILTSGCGGGVSFDEGETLPPVAADLSLSPRQLTKAMKLLQGAEMPARDGMHRSALSDGERLLVVARDVGRHNTLDKIWGECLFQGINPAGKLLLSSGRLSSEMVVKAARMGVPVVASLNSATDRAVGLGKRLGITLAGHVRGTRMDVYCHRERLDGANGE